ncbi:hypothetical protein [Bradyrhizobium nanningense]|uniref:hypothetical protein n=1 Tax=Bradyrhizobium nanningense TaxID=1325118 RepID=UPI001FE19245|nr:hypothetical protein [Bradyrhizobium nanningense]
MTQAFMDAMDDATALIGKKLAAEIYAKSSRIKVDPIEIQEMIEDPDTRFSAIPTGMMKFAEFMYRAGRSNCSRRNGPTCSFPNSRAAREIRTAASRLKARYLVCSCN